MTIESNSPQSSTPETNQPDSIPDGLKNEKGIIAEGLATQEALAALLQSPQHAMAVAQARSIVKPANIGAVKPRALLLIVVAIALTFIGITFNNPIIGISGTVIALGLSLAVILPWVQAVINQLSAGEKSVIVAFCGLVVGLIGLIKFTGFYHRLIRWEHEIDWQASGTLAEWFGALGQILIAVIAVYVAWRQYIISKDLTIQQNLLTVQQNLITQQQTIDTYFQGISELILDQGGLLEDWPQERLLAEGRTAAILSSVDGHGKAKIIRFLSRSKLLTPLKRDRHLGRAILDGEGGYAIDRADGLRVIDLGVMLAGADLARTDLRWCDLSEINLVRANLSGCDLVKANLSRTILYEATLAGADLNGTYLFYGLADIATPRSRSQSPDYKTGAYTGAVIENADFTNVKRMSVAMRCYCCSWGGEKTRKTIPGGCEEFENKLGR